MEPREEVTLNTSLIEDRMAQLGIKDTMELARTAKVSYSSLRRAFTGERKPSALLLLKLVDSLELDFKELLNVSHSNLEKEAA